MNQLGKLVLVVCSSLVVAGCGRKGALIYPDMLVPAAPAAVSATQFGSSVKLQFVLPDKDRAGRPVKEVSGVRITKKGDETGQQDICRSCMADYLMLTTLYLDSLQSTAQRFGSRLVVLDGDVGAGTTYSYIIIPFTAGGVDGASAQISDVHVTTPVPAPVLSIEPLPAEIKLHIAPSPALTERLIGYNLYRWPVAGSRRYLPLNREPLNNTEYIDATPERGVKYHYSARAVVMTASGNIAESIESAEVEGMLKDDE